VGVGLEDWLGLIFKVSFKPPPPMLGRDGGASGRVGGGRGCHWDTAFDRNLFVSVNLSLPCVVEVSLHIQLQ